jgi:hypothetical protein
MQRYAEFTTKLSRGSLAQPANQFALAWSADRSGALRKQFYVGGHFRLEEREAFDRTEERFWEISRDLRPSRHWNVQTKSRRSSNNLCYCRP